MCFSVSPSVPFSSFNFFVGFCLCRMHGGATAVLVVVAPKFPPLHNQVAIIRFVSFFQCSYLLFGVTVVSLCVVSFHSFLLLL